MVNWAAKCLTFSHREQYTEIGNVNIGQAHILATSVGAGKGLYEGARTVAIGLKLQLTSAQRTNNPLMCLH